MPSTAVTATVTEAHSGGQDTLETAPPEQTTTSATSSWFKPDKPVSAPSSRAAEKRVAKMDAEELRREGVRVNTSASLATFVLSDIQPSEEIESVAAWQRLRYLLHEWLADDSGYDEETWPKLKAALDQDRLSARSLFDE